MKDGKAGQLQTEMTVRRKQSLNIFLSKTHKLLNICKVREEIDSLSFRPGTMDDAFIKISYRKETFANVSFIENGIYLYCNRSEYFSSLLGVLDFLPPVSFFLAET